MLSPFYPGNPIDNLATWSEKVAAMSRIMSQLIWLDQKGQVDLTTLQCDHLAEVIADYAEAIHETVEGLPGDMYTQLDRHEKKDALVDDHCKTLLEEVVKCNNCIAE